MRATSKLFACVEIRLALNAKRRILPAPLSATSGYGFQRHRARLVLALTTPPNEFADNPPMHFRIVASGMVVCEKTLGARQQVADHDSALGPRERLPRDVNFNKPGIEN